MLMIDRFELGMFFFSSFSPIIVFDLIIIMYYSTDLAKELISIVSIDS